MSCFHYLLAGRASRALAYTTPLDRPATTALGAMKAWACCRLKTARGRHTPTFILLRPDCYNMTVRLLRLRWVRDTGKTHSVGVSETATSSVVYVWGKPKSFAAGPDLLRTAWAAFTGAARESTSSFHDIAGPILSDSDIMTLSCACRVIRPRPAANRIMAPSFM